MRFATFIHQGLRQVGQVSADGRTVTAFDLAPQDAGRGMLSVIEQLVQGRKLPALAGAALPLENVKLEAPIPLPRRNIWCVGRNYHAHAKELSASVFKNNSADPAAWPIVFTKVPECVVGPTDFVDMPPAYISTASDYEAELAVIIGKGGKGIAAKDAMSHVWGYTIVNDVTARDWQSRHQQWHMGKSFDTFCPMGPYLVSADECDGTKTMVRCYVNGELRQNASTTDLIFDIPKLIETLSAGITLYPGDVIATGTPVGVGIGFKPPKYLVAGDVVRVEIDGIGALENPLR